MKMLVMSMKADPECRAYTPGNYRPLGVAAAAQPGLLCQAYMDDLALFAQTTEAAQAELSASSAFLGAYGMTFNRNKAHSCQLQPS
jgi:hypothetical protein